MTAIARSCFGLAALLCLLGCGGATSRDQDTPGSGGASEVGGGATTSGGRNEGAGGGAGDNPGAAGAEPGFLQDCWGECAIWASATTGLSWSDPPGEDMVWSDALWYCDLLDIDGFSDWRLPTIGELRTIILGCSATATGGACGVTDDCLAATCHNATSCAGCTEYGGPNEGWYLAEELTPLPWYVGMVHSASEVEGEAGHTWGVNFETGHVYSGGTGHALVRCVR